MTVVCQDRYRDASGDFKDGRAFFCRCVAWGNLAEHIASTVSKGCRLVVTGEFVSSSWDKEDGTKGYATDLRLSDAAVSLLWAEAQVVRVRGSRRQGSEVAPSWGLNSPQGDREVDPWAAGSTASATPVPEPSY